MLLAVLAAGCDSPPGRAFSAQLPPIDVRAAGDVNLGPLPVELRDLTGTVVAIATDEHLPEDDVGLPGGPRAVAMLDRPNAMRVLWLGSMCSRVVRMQLSGSAGALALAIQDDWDPPILGGVCPAGAVSRVAIIGFNGPVDPAAVEVRTNVED
jgi:hypothetical protein